MIASRVASVTSRSVEPAAWLVLVPLAFASLLTGLVSSLATKWGLFRHYWVLFKLVITVAATLILLTYMETFAALAAVAADPTADLELVRNPSPMLHAVLALLGLLVATVLGVYKPQAMTRYGWRKQLDQAAARVGSTREPPAHSPRWVKVSGTILGLALLFLLFMHRHGHGPVGH
jgi:hypothetical protein